MTSYIGEIAPHGGVLVDRMLRGAERENAIGRARSMQKIVLNTVNISDLELLASGTLSPLTGFMSQRDYAAVLANTRMDNGLVWSIPITLPVTRPVADALKIGEEIALTEPDGHSSP